MPKNKTFNNQLFREIDRQAGRQAEVVFLGDKSFLLECDLSAFTLLKALKGWLFHCHLDKPASDWSWCYVAFCPVKRVDMQLWKETAILGEIILHLKSRTAEHRMG